MVSLALTSMRLQEMLYDVSRAATETMFSLVMHFRKT